MDESSASSEGVGLAKGTVAAAVLDLTPQGYTVAKQALPVLTEACNGALARVCVELEYAN